LFALNLPLPFGIHCRLEFDRQQQQQFKLPSSKQATRLIATRIKKQQMAKAAIEEY